MLKFLFILLLGSVAALKSENKLVNEMLEVYSDYLESNDPKEDSSDAGLEYNEVYADDGINDPSSPPRKPCKIGDKTSKPEPCKVGDKTYKSGARFTQGCSRCTCGRSGGHYCMPLCAPSRIMCRSDQKEITVKVKVTDDCSCPTPKCVAKDSSDAGLENNEVYADDNMNDPTSPMRRPCKVGNKIYKRNARFTQGCSRCTCGGSGGYYCTPLCAPSRIMCRSDQKEISVKVKVTDDCSCPTPKCVAKDSSDAGLEYNEVYADDRINDPGSKPRPKILVCRLPDGKTVKAGSYFNDGCNRCKCRGDSFSCVPRCSQARIMCRSNQKVATYQRKISDDCSCPTEKCVSKDSRDEELNAQVNEDDIMEDAKDCTMPDGKVYKAGSSFFNEDCNRCRCRRGNLSCVSGCPPVRVMCNAGQKKVMVKQKLSDKCSCKVPKCV